MNDRISQEHLHRDEKHLSVSENGQPEPVLVRSQPILLAKERNTRGGTA